MIKQAIAAAIISFVVNGNALAVDETDNNCQKISDKLASVSYKECAALQLTVSEHYSVDGFPLLMKEYPPLESRLPKGRVLLVGGTHGDELASISIVFKWMQTLEKHHSGLFHWRVAPLMNPDGALRNKHQHTNSNGVDLNRNFATPDQQINSALEYWKFKTKSNSRRYPGPYTFKRARNLLVISGNNNLQT